MQKPTKPLGRKAYGSIGHLPNSRLGPGDHCVNQGQADIATLKCRPGDTVIVQEKLDGSNVAVARIGNELVPLMRAGYRAVDSPHEQHHLFAKWVYRNSQLFDFLLDGERVCGEWLALAHGTIYDLYHDPFVAFDIMREDVRLTYGESVNRLAGAGLTMPHLLHAGSALPVHRALELLGPRGHHGARDEVEGVVWRVEREGRVDFLTKYVKPDKVDGKYFTQVSGKSEIWNWRPEAQL